jgi:DNA-binding transcriptional regulator YiaG
MALALDRHYRVLKTAMPYRYKESGLDNVVLRRGYTIRQTPYGETVAIHDVDGVHRKIAAKLVKQPHLTGAELRFLRLEMDKTQAELAETLGTTEQTLSLWERDRKKPIPDTAAKLLQVIADGHFGLTFNLKKRGAIDQAIKKGLRLGTVAVFPPRYGAQVGILHKAPWWRRRGTPMGVMRTAKKATKHPAARKKK